VGLIFSADDFENKMKASSCEGTTIKTCNYKFVFANVTMNEPFGSKISWRDAAAECCKRNMRMLTVPNAKKLACLKEAFVKGI
jgi:hypothetical protein